MRMNAGSVEKKLLKAILWVYIALCVGIAGLNYGVAPRADERTAQFLTCFWHFYENWVKTAFIIAASILTIRIAGRSGKTALRRKNLIGFTAAALVVHVALPLVSGNYEWYFFTMPFPWTTTPLQLLDAGSAFHLSRFPVWGAAGMTGVMVFYAAVTALVFVGTVLFGRRMQCSMLCLFNGFAAEVFDPAMPLIGKRRKPGKAQKTALSIARMALLTIALLFTLWWLGSLLGLTPASARAAFTKAETYVYLAGELMMAMFFWVAFIGRGYCYYCPLGTVLSVLSRLGGQRIDTARTHCVQCGRCTEVCPMAIDVKEAAAEGLPLHHSRCVGCGRCVDACPTQTLRYTTRFLEKMRENLSPTLGFEISKNDPGDRCAGKHKRTTDCSEPNERFTHVQLYPNADKSRAAQFRLQISGRPRFLEGSPRARRPCPAKKAPSGSRRPRSRTALL